MVTTSSVNRSRRSVWNLAGPVLMAFCALPTSARPSPNGDSLTGFRKSFFLPGNDPCRARDLIEAAESDREGDPIALAYRGAGLAMFSQCLKSPFAKLRNFTRGREAIERAIALNPSDPEIRFIRFMVQNGAPAFLSYDNRDEDLSMVARPLTQVPRDGEDQLFMNNVSTALATNDLTKPLEAGPTDARVNEFDI